MSKSVRVCWIKDCTNKAYGHWLCQKHYLWVKYNCDKDFRTKEMRKSRGYTKERVEHERARRESLKGLSVDELLSVVDYEVVPLVEKRVRFDA